MAKSHRLRTRDLRGLYLLLGECCQLGADPVAWHRHLVERLPALFGAQMAQHMEMVVVTKPFGPPHWLRMLSHFDTGWATPSDRKPLEEHLKSGRPEDGPHFTPDLFKRRLKVAHWVGDLGLAGWHRSAFFNENVKWSHLDDMLMGSHLTESGSLRGTLVNRALGDRPFTGRERRLMALLNAEQANLLGHRLARVRGPGVGDLPPRQREVLVCLMSGDSELQAALRLGISRHTVHDYVKALHARFGVSSRGELLAHCRAFWPVLEQEAKRLESNGRNRRADR